MPFLTSLGDFFVHIVVTRSTKSRAGDFKTRHKNTVRREREVTPRVTITMTVCFGYWSGCRPSENLFGRGEIPDSLRKRDLFLSCEHQIILREITNIM